jgi:uncharacterized Zn finger protein (UPF0148 family)
MSTDDMRSYEPSAIKNAAELLTRGASLINEACPKCRGVQVKFKEVITCINCGHEQKSSKDVSSIHSKQRSIFESKGESKSSQLELIEDKITDKIVKLISMLDDEDLSEEKKKADLLELYLRIIEKTRQLKNKFDLEMSDANRH